jgi:hypothetical protein
MEVSDFENITDPGGLGLNWVQRSSPIEHASLRHYCLMRRSLWRDRGMTSPPPWSIDELQSVRPKLETNFGLPEEASDDAIEAFVSAAVDFISQSYDDLRRAAFLAASKLPSKFRR